MLRVRFITAEEGGLALEFFFVYPVKKIINTVNLTTIYLFYFIDANICSLIIIHTSIDKLGIGNNT